MRTRYAELCREFGVVIPPQARAGLLSVADQQALEIMRGLESNARIMVLDEPTASLAVHEREALYEIIGRLSRRGVAVIFISHDLDEVLVSRIRSPCCATGERSTRDRRANGRSRRS
jgi:ABC-type sugar transport system ATPase subunit